MNSTRGSTRGLKRAVWLGGWLALSAGGCRAPAPAPPPPPPPPPGPSTLAPGDVVEVKFFFTPELAETQSVRPDGKIVLHLLGEVHVAGLTAEELRDDLLEQYTPHLRDPDISVLVRDSSRRQVFVSGEVRTPGPVSMPGRLSVLEAVLHAGGLNATEAEARNVLVIRHQDGSRRGYAVDLKRALRGEPATPFYLEPLDIVHVPRTRIVQIGQWIDQHINKIVPQFGFRYTQPLGDGTIGIDTSNTR